MGKETPLSTPVTNSQTVNVSYAIASEALRIWLDSSCTFELRLVPRPEHRYDIVLTYAPAYAERVQMFLQVIHCFIGVEEKSARAAKRKEL